MAVQWSVLLHGVRQDVVTEQWRVVVNIRHVDDYSGARGLRRSSFVTSQNCEVVLVDVLPVQAVKSERNLL